MRGIWREVVAVVRRYPLATTLPAGGLGAGAASLHLATDDLVGLVMGGIVLVIAFEFYVAYVERLLDEFERGMRRPGVAAIVRYTTPIVPALMAASVIGITVPFAAGGLLVIPGLWLATRWSLFAPIISRERAGPIEAIRRSNHLVRGHFWPVFATVTVALLIEVGALQATARAAEAVTDSRLLILAAAGILVGAVSPPAALTIAIAYGRLTSNVQERSSA